MKILTLASILLFGVAATPIMASSYTVKKGDTLYGIARKHSISPQSLMKINGIGSSGVIVPGQKLKVNGSSSSTKKSKSTTSTKPKSSKRSSSSYKVAKGDTFYGIARKHNLTSSKLKALNPSVNANRILVGTTLKVTGTASSPSKSPAKAKAAPKSTPKKPVAKSSPKPTAKTAKKPTPKSSVPKPKAPSIAKQPAPIVDEPIYTPAAAAPEPKPAPVNNEPFIEPDIDLESSSDSSSSNSLIDSNGNPETISSVTVDQEISYSKFANQHGATTTQLNELNGLSLKSSTTLAKGSELYVPSSL